MRPRFSASSTSSSSVSFRVAQTMRNPANAGSAFRLGEAFIAVARSFGALRQPQDDMLPAARPWFALA